MFRNLKIGVKILLGFLVSLVFLIALSVTVYFTTSGTNDNLAVINELFKFQQSASRFSEYYNEARIGANAIYASSGQEEYEHVVNGYNAAVDALSEMSETLASGVLPPGLAESLSAVDTVSSVLSSWKTAIDALNASNNKIDEMRSAVYRSSEALTNAINEIYYDQSTKMDSEILSDSSRSDLRVRRGLMQQGVTLMVGAYTMRSSFLRMVDFLDLSDLAASLSYAKNLASNLRKITATSASSLSEGEEYALGVSAQKRLDEYLALIDEFTVLTQEHQQTIASATDYGASAVSAVTRMLSDINSAVEAENSSAALQGQRAIIIAFALSAVAIVLSVLLALLIVRSITRPVSDMVAAAERLAAGDLNLGNLRQRSKDEIGVLTGCIIKVSRVISDLINELHKMSDAHDAGETDARVPESQFKGSYAEVAARSNGMIAAYLTHITDMCKVLDAFGLGDFEAHYARLPGKKAMLNDVVEQLRADLKEIHEEIDSLAAGALNGDLSVRAKDHNFHGDWKSLLAGLNSLMDAFIAPIHEAGEVCLAMSRGDLKSKVSGNYHGDFEIIKRALNATQEAISSYISEISAILQQMSDQNLNVRITREYIGDFDIIKRSINMIIDTFNDCLADIAATAQEVATGSRQISESSMTLSDGAARQANAVEELNTAIAKVAEQIDKNAEIAQKADTLALSTKTNAAAGNEEMKSMLSAMQEINDASANISSVIKIIQDIAFQTNLLALNAAVEAARAGSYGKGFAVVAQEVRNLANRSQTAANNTSEMVQSSIEKVKYGSHIADKTADALNVIIGQMTEVGSYVQRIASASAEQSVNIGHINTGIEQVLQVTQANTAISEESASAAEELSSQAQMFESTVEKFKLKDGARHSKTAGGEN